MAEEVFDCWCGWVGKGREAAAAHWSETDHDAMLRDSAGQFYSELVVYRTKGYYAALQAIYELDQEPASGIAHRALLGLPLEEKGDGAK